MPLLAPSLVTWWGEEGAHEGFLWQWWSTAGSWGGLGPSGLDTVVRQRGPDNNATAPSWREILVPGLLTHLRSSVAIPR